jgi:hypothetical protein
MEQFDLFEIGRPGRPDAKNFPAPGKEINQNGAAAPQAGYPPWRNRLKT